VSATFRYVVRIAFVEREAMEGFVVWLRDRHIEDVCDAGAIDAELLRLDVQADGRHAVEARYGFASREEFTRYERDHAPRLRADGLAQLARLGVPSDRVTFTRTTGEIVLRR
jgi:Domain of unknown function (DUF4286)